MANNDLKQQDSAMLSSDEERIGKLLTSLPRVDAPGDFDFRVRARIAAGRPARGRVSWLPASVKMAVPLVLVLAGGYVAFNTYYLVGDIDGPAVVENAQQNFAPVTGPPANDSTVLPINGQVADLIDVKPPEIANSEFARNPGPTLANRNRRDVRPTGGSFNTALGVANSLRPTGSSSNTNLTPQPNAPVQSAGQFLSSAGIQAISAMGGWKVQSVTPGSSAERSGVKAGDMVSIVPLSRTLMIRRDGKQIRIDLKP